MNKHPICEKCNHSTCEYQGRKGYDICNDVEKVHDEARKQEMKKV